MICTVYDPNRQKVNGKMKSFKCHDLHNAQKIRQFHSELSQVSVRTRPTKGGKNPRRAVLISINGGQAQ